MIRIECLILIIENPMMNVYNCRHKVNTICTSWGDPHIVSFDTAKIDVYGVAQYIMAQSDGTFDINGTQEIPPFKISMNTKKYRHVATIDHMYFLFVGRDGTEYEIETTYYGKSAIYINGEWRQLYPQTTGDFTFKKAGNKMWIKVWHGIEVYHGGYTYTVRLPGYYDSKVYGLCGDMNLIRFDDYILKDGTLVPMPNRDTYKLTQSEFLIGNSWIVGSADLRGCLPYKIVDPPLEDLEPVVNPEVEDLPDPLCQGENIYNLIQRRSLV